MTPGGRAPSADAGAVVVYWRPGCPFCARLLPRLRHSGIPLREHDIWSDPAAAAVLRRLTGGGETVPTVTLGDRVLINPSMRAVHRAVETDAPELLPESSRPARRPGVFARLFRRVDR